MQRNGPVALCAYLSIGIPCNGTKNISFKLEAVSETGPSKLKKPTCKYFLQRWLHWQRKIFRHSVGQAYTTRFEYRNVRTQKQTH